MTSPSYLHAAPSEERISVGQTVITPLLDSDETGESITMFRMEAPAGSGMPAAHYHEAYDETIHVHDGAITFTIEGDDVVVAAGETLFIPRGAVHFFANRGDAPVVATCVITPGVLSLDFFREAGAAIVPGTPPDPQVVGPILRRHGLVPVAPGS